MKGFSGFGNSPAKEDSSENQENQQEDGGNKWKEGLKKFGDVAIASLTGGLDAVYGSGKINPGGTITFSKDKKKKNNEKSGADKVDEQLA